MIIGVTGYGATGASACIDLIKEFQDVQSYRASFEFQLLQQTDGIIDLKYGLVKAGRRLHSDACIERFLRNLDNPRAYYIGKETKGRYRALSLAYIKELTQLSWLGRSNYDPIDLHKSYDRLKNRNVTHAIDKGVQRLNNTLAWPPKKERYFSFMSEDEFDEITKQYLAGILEASGFEKNKPVLLEQLFNTRDPLEGAEFFDEARSIVVDRDPRDVYVITNLYLPHLCNFMPNTGDVVDFVKYYRALHGTKRNDQHVLYVQYEDLIYQYEKSCSELKSFLGNPAHPGKGTKFKPQFSINNTQSYKRYPQYEDAFRYIEQQLPDYLYPFEEMESTLSFERVETELFDRQLEIDRKTKSQCVDEQKRKK